MKKDIIMEINNLKKHFPVKSSLLRRTTGHVKAVDDVSLSIKHGETFGLVGESGCGKSTLGMCLMGLLNLTSGSVLYNFNNHDYDLAKMTRKEQFVYSEKVQIVFQDPYSALNPLKTIYEAFDEPLKVHGMKNKKDRYDRIIQGFESVNLQPSYMYRYPHEFSGGQRQRICIARALCINPELLICDEPVSALDVSIQSQVLNMLLDIQKEKNLTYIFIAHDLSIVQYMSDRIAVMYLGKIVELADSFEVYDFPFHHYTQALLSAVPVPDLDIQKERIILEGDVPSPLKAPSGCKFHTRCVKCQQICKEQEPQLKDLKGNGHFVACHFPIVY